MSKPTPEDRTWIERERELSRVAHRNMQDILDRVDARLRFADERGARRRRSLLRFVGRA